MPGKFGLRYLLLATFGARLLAFLGVSATGHISGGTRRATGPYVDMFLQA